MKVDPRFLREQGWEIFTGNELLVKGALESEGGVHLLGGYPGSPIAGFFDSLSVIKDLLNEKGIRAVINHNEALAAAMLNGTQSVACRAMIAMKSVGVHVAADGLALGNMAGVHPDGGAVVIYGDDPWSDSTQVAADSRYISKHLYIPVIEPSCAQEVKDYVGLAFQISQTSDLYIGYLLTTNLADGGGSVQCRPNQYPAFNTVQKIALDTAAINLDKRVLLPPRTWWQEEAMDDRFGRAIAAARKLGVNRIDYPAGDGTRKPLGFVTSGLAAAYLSQALSDLGVLGELPILKFGMSYPLDGELVRQLAGQCERIIVVEERRGFLEEQIGEILLRARQAGEQAGQVELWGKQFPYDLGGLPATRGLHPSILTERLGPLLKRTCGPDAATVAPARKIDRELEQIARTAELESDLPPLPLRIASFCPGCPHRDSADLCLEIKKRLMDEQYMQRRYHRGPVDLLFHGDTGCYTMLMFPPNTPLMHDYSGMGLGGGTGSGTDPFLTNKEVVFMGDSTFFHSGQLAISQAIKLCQDITFILLDNSTTAMTGHQPTPGVEYDVLGNPTPVQDIEEIINGIVSGPGATVVRVDPEKRADYGELLERTFLADGVKIIIADKECGITRTRRKRRGERAVIRRKGFLPAWQHMNINAEICNFCLSCAEMTGCPGLKHTETDYGRKMDTDVTWCVDDGACERIGACCSFERVLVKRTRKPRPKAPDLGLDNIPEPPKRPCGELWRCCLVGVGGMGIGLATSILVRAGHKEGHKVVFVDKKGLAIRNGGVVSQVTYNLSDRPTSAVIPYGQADLLLGIDILEAARAIDPKGRTRAAAADRTAAVLNTDKIQTIPGLMGRSDFDGDALARLLRDHTRSDDYLARNISRICEKYLGSKLYANIMMLGFAFQKGLIPVSMHSMAWAIKDTIRADFRKNLYAFNMGRKLVLAEDLFQGPPVRSDWRDLLEEKCRCTIRRHRRGGQQLADRFRELTASTIADVAELSDELKRAIVVRAYDCLRWDGLDYARRYTRSVGELYAKDSADYGYAATSAAVYNLADAMLIKDGVFMAELSTSPEKYARDRLKYNVNPANGDRLSYRHLWHWRWRIGRRRFTFTATLRPWMLKRLRNMRWLRKLLPGWGRRQRRFGSQYAAKLAEFSYTTPQEYRSRLAEISSPQCFDCLNPLCAETGCPLHSPVPQWVELAYQQRWREAAELLHRWNNFPEITSRVCPAPCRDVCKQGAGEYPVQIRDIEFQIADRALREGWVTAQPAAMATGKTVAVVGAGPAALAAAQQLARAGHQVTCFEKDSAPGGLLRYGIPAERLGRDLLDRRVRQLQDEGVTFRTGVEIGADLAAAELLDRFDAVLLAVGAAQPRELDIPGRQLRGVHQAVDFLRHLNAGPDDNVEPVCVLDKVVVVIGGGLTGEDCVEGALRAGAKEVHQLEILRQSDAAPSGIDNANENASSRLKRQFSVATKQFAAGDAGELRQLDAVRVRWVQGVDGTIMKDLPGGKFTIQADVALLAIGSDPTPGSQLAEQLQLAMDDKGRIVLAEFATSVAGVFAAGDLATGATNVAAAIASGRQAAEQIDAYLGK